MKKNAMQNSEVEVYEDFHDEHHTLVVTAFIAAKRYLGGLSAVINAAFADGVQRKEIIEWGIEAGWSESRVRSVVSDCFVKAGKKNPNIQGKQYDQRAIDLQAEIVHRFGTDGVKLLLSAYRYAKAQEKAAAVQPVAKVA